jgi:hypothetical protein
MLFPFRTGLRMLGPPALFPPRYDAPGAKCHLLLLSTKKLSPYKPYETCNRSNFSFFFWILKKHTERRKERKMTESIFLVVVLLGETSI